MGGVRVNRKLVRGKYWLPVLGVSGCKVCQAVPAVDVLVASQGIRFGAQSARPEFDQDVELRQEFGPMGLSMREYLGLTEPFQVLVVGEY